MTGGAGFVGSHIVDNLVSQGAEVLVVDDLSTGKQNNLPGSIELAELDIRTEAAKQAITSYKPDVVSHCAAQASVPGSMADPARDASINIHGGINVCMAAAESGCHALIYINTGGALYGEPEYHPCDEDHPIRPKSAYGLSKWTVENYMPILLPDRIKSSSLRLANVYGPRQDPFGESGVVSIFSLQMLQNEPVTIFGDGNQTRDYVFVKDVARAHEMAVRSDDRVTVNVGTGVGTTVNGLFAILADRTGYIREPLHGPERPGDVAHITLDSTQAKNVLGWEPRKGLNDGLRETVDWFKTQW